MNDTRGALKSFLFHTAIPFCIKMKRITYQRKNRTVGQRRRRLNRRGHLRRRRRSRSESNLLPQSNHHPTWAGSKAPAILQNGHDGHKFRRPLSKKMKTFGAWMGFKVCTNAVSNKYILSSRSSKYVVTKTSQKQNDGSQKQQLRGKRVVFHGSPKTKEVL